MSSHPLIHRQLFRRISYTARFRIICGFGLLMTAYMLYAYFLLQTPIMSSYEMKIEGIERHKNLVTLLKASVNRVENNQNFHPAELQSKKSKDILREIYLNYSKYNLALTTDLDTYLIADAIILHLPSIQANIVDLAFRYSKDGVIDPYDTLYLNLRRELNSVDFDSENFKNGNDIRLCKAFIADISKYLDQMFINPSREDFPVHESLTDVVKRGWELSDSFISTYESSQKDGLKFLNVKKYTFTALCALIAFIFVFAYITKLFLGPIEHLIKAAQEFSKGNYSVRVDTSDHDEIASIGRSFNILAALWERSVIKTREITDRLVINSTTIYHSAKTLEENVKIERVDVQNIETLIKESVVTGNKFADLLLKMNRSISATSSLAGKGTATLSEMEETMKKMLETSSQMVGDLDNIRLHLGKINGVISSVVTITDQSNLLSINTAIKASRSGEIGKGFVVVAGTIKELADQTALATLDIEKAAQDIVSVMGNAIMEAVRFSNKIYEQVKEGNAVNLSLKNRLEYTKHQIQSFDSINKGMNQQIVDSKQISSLILKFSESTVKTDEGAHKFYSEAQSLYDTTNELYALFKDVK